MARLFLILLGIALTPLTSCSKPNLGVRIPVAAHWDGRPVECAGSGIALSDLRFYLSAIKLIDAHGALRDLELQTDLPWQQRDLALIDLENGQGACTNGTDETSAYLVGSVAPGDYRGLRFTVGVPFDRNHANPLQADPPLDDPAMHWHWRSGYKFLRAGVKKDGDGFWFHLGSTGCEGAVGRISGCRFPNRVTVDLQEFVPNRDGIALDLKILFDGVDLDDGEPGSCSSGPAEAGCIEPLAALGLGFPGDAPAGPQPAFSIHR